MTALKSPQPWPHCLDPHHCHLQHPHTCWPICVLQGQPGAAALPPLLSWAESLSYPAELRPQ